MENNSGVEIVLLNVVRQLKEKGEQMYKASGNESYVERCHYYDAQQLIYGLTNECKKHIENFKQITSEKNHIDI